MCGIFGYISFNNNKINRAKFDQSLHTIIHRGPDFQKSLFLKNETVALGHVRLSIIDLSDAANQPMAVDKYYVIYNGEIYNYIELRNELVLNGYSFTTNSDTEVLVKAYDYWGEDCESKFNGMWAFAIYNTIDDTFFCSRDRFGVKPFNYYYDKERFIFSSEIKPIITYIPELRKPNYNSIGLFCREGVCGDMPETWFMNVHRLQPGHNIKIQNGNVKIGRYYACPTKINKNISISEAKNKFNNLFLDSVKLRMRSDVPVGTALSGGLDSTSIVSVLRTFYKGEHRTYTASFPNFEKDEYNVANLTNNKLNLKGSLINCQYDTQYFETLKKVIYHLESGHLSPSIIPLWKVYEGASKEVRVVLEGQGADELLGGYIDSAFSIYLLDKLEHLELKKFFYNLKVCNISKESFILFLRYILPYKIREWIRKRSFSNGKILIGPLAKSINTTVFITSRSRFSKYLQLSHQSTLVNLIHYGDAISMAFSIESRLPFMDYRLVDLVMSLPPEFLICEGKGKYIQREALKEFLPINIYSSKEKLGFPSPSNEFFNRNRASLKDILLSPKAKSRGIFDSSELETLLDSDFDKPYQPSRFIFRIVCVELWFRQFID